MLKKIQIITCSAILTLGTATISYAETLPTADSQGDYMGRDGHDFWEVVDPDPNGLNCRMINASLQQLMSMSNTRPSDIFNWPVVGVLKEGQRFKSFSSNAGSTFRDTRKLPWLFVGKSYNDGAAQGCFVRANSAFVKPVPISSNTLQSPSSQSFSTSTALPMRISFDEGFGMILVPDNDTTISAYGGRLSRYDVHIAKMFEVTHFMCQQRMVSPRIKWNYAAGGGSINMGNFDISCQLANEIASAYGLGKSEMTSISFSGGHLMNL